MANTPNLKKLYQDEVAPALMQKFGYKSTMQIPRLEKIVSTWAAARPVRTPRCWTPWCPT